MKELEKMGMDIDRTKKLIKLHEGLRLMPYKCPAGKWTWGYGRNLEDNPLTSLEQVNLLHNVYEATNPDDKRDILLNLAEESLRNELFHLCFELSRLDHLVWSNCSEVRKAVLADMTYNLGIDGFRKFVRTRQYIRLGKFEKAAMEMTDSLWAEQVKTRAVRLIEMMISDKWPQEIG